MDKSFKVLLINPPWYRLFGQAFNYYPIGLCYLAGVLEKDGFNVSVYNADYNYRELRGEFLTFTVRKVIEGYKKYLSILKDMNNPLWQEIKQVICQQSPDIVGITVTTAKFGAAINVAKLVKELDPTMPVIVGGVHPTILPEEMLKNKEVDIVVRGEGERTILDLVRTLQLEESVDNVLGITYKKHGRIIHNPDRPLIENLDDLPFPARHLLLEKETYPSGAYQGIFAARGCPYHCTFCASYKVWTRRVRYRSPENVVGEIRHVKETFGTCHFHFEDDSFGLNKDYTVKLCNLLIKENLKISWDCEARADMLTDDIAPKMKAAGCEAVQIGVESGDEEILRRIKKGITIKQVKRSAKILHQNRLTFNAFFMIGFPQEKRREIEKTVSLMKELNPNFAVYSIVTPYPGTELYDTCSSEGLIPQNIDWSIFFHQSPQMFLNRNFTREEAYQIIRYTQQVFDRHNRQKVLKKIVTNPFAALRIVLTRGYYKPRFLISLLRSLLKA